MRKLNALALQSRASGSARVDGAGESREGQNREELHDCYSMDLTAIAPEDRLCD